MVENKNIKVIKCKQKKHGVKTIVCWVALSCVPLINTSQAASSSCSESVPKICWKADSLYFKDTTYYTVVGCQTKKYILNTVSGSDCLPKSDGYKMFSAQQANWVSMKTITAKWVGNGTTGFCQRITTVDDGVSVTCSECRLDIGPDGSQRCSP